MSLQARFGTFDKNNSSLKKIFKKCIFFSFQAHLACSWPGIKVTTKWRPSWICCINDTIFFTFELFLENCIECMENN